MKYLSPAPSRSDYIECLCCEVESHYERANCECYWSDESYQKDEKVCDLHREEE